MSNQRSIRLSLAGAIALAVYGVASVATAQPAPQQAAQQVPPPPPPPAQPMPPPPPAPPFPPDLATTAPPQAVPAQPMPPRPTQPPAASQGTTPSPPPATPAQPMPAQGASGQPDSGQFLQGSRSSASYPLPGSNGGTLTVNSGMPANVRNYGPPPSFNTLDTNHDGRISEAEAVAYPPLDSDFLYASGQAKSISRAQYQKWVQALGQQ